MQCGMQLVAWSWCHYATSECMRARSALTEEAEALLYDLCQTSGITTISVGHRESVRRMHSRVLLMEHGGKWSLLSSES